MHIFDTPRQIYPDTCFLYICVLESKLVTTTKVSKEHVCQLINLVGTKSLTDRRTDRWTDGRTEERHTMEKWHLGANLLTQEIRKHRYNQGFSSLLWPICQQHFRPCEFHCNVRFASKLLFYLNYQTVLRNSYINICILSGDLGRMELLSVIGNEHKMEGVGHIADFKLMHAWIALLFLNDTILQRSNAFT